MQRLILAGTLVVILVLSAVWTGRAQQPAGGGALFTGVSMTMDAKDLSIARRHFDAAARTYWHSHEHGQLLMVEQGKMRLQKRGQKMQELGTGQTDYTAPNVEHWHGATPDQPLVQINAGFGGSTKWLAEVTADEYAGKRK
jgi:quercetin dioxygenase-like cupin family protein